MHLGAAAVAAAVSGWWKSILDRGYSGASSHISLDMNLRLRSTCRSSPFGFSFLVSFVLLPATSTVVRRRYLPASLHPNPDLSPSFAVSRLLYLISSRFSPSLAFSPPSFCIEDAVLRATRVLQIFVPLFSPSVAVLIICRFIDGIFNEMMCHG